MLSVWYAIQKYLFLYFLHHLCFSYPASKQDAVDTTGAGDIFLGAFVAAIEKGHDCDYAIRFANYAINLSAPRNGA